MHVRIGIRGRSDTKRWDDETAQARVVLRGLPGRVRSNRHSEREVVVNIVWGVTRHGRPEDTLRDSEDHYGRMVELSSVSVIEHSSGGPPSANVAGAKLRSSSEGVPRQVSSELCPSLPPGVGGVRDLVRLEGEETGKYGEKQPW